MASPMSNKELATLIKKMSKMSKGERAFEYLKLSDRGVNDSICGFLAFSDGGSLDLANELEEKSAEMTPSAKEDTLELVSLLRR
ncbi:hypothetical protein LCGC14_2612630 [marine sediment metagenome]|uniref:Uncharacterized protein n=1 Tax=marine sediment metagenome TaxID=412755 RepID=A0A0F9A5F9_9ZZZZ